MRRRCATDSVILERHARRLPRDERVRPTFPRRRPTLWGKIDMEKLCVCAAFGLFGLAVSVGAIRAAEFPKFEAKEIDPHVGAVCYALTIADVNGDKKPDVVALTEDAVVWFVNPTWEKRIILKGKTERDNVCIQLRDLNGDGRVDFVVGAAWRPTDTKSGGTLQWLESGDSGWTVRPIAAEPTLHRMRFGDVHGNGRDQLIVSPLQGRGTKGPNWNEGDGSRIMVFTIPKDPAQTPWPMEVAEKDLHTVHNLQVVDVDGDGRQDLLLAAWEGVFLLQRDAAGRWSKTKLGTGNQDAKPFKGASEIKLGRLKNGGALHRDDRALARLPSRRLHAAQIDRKRDALGAPSR